MTTVNTIEDLVRILAERPEWNEALRTRMLSRELLNLPRAIAFEIYRPVTPAKAGVQRAQNEDNDLETADFRHWIPAFAGMTVAESAGLMS